MPGGSKECPRCGLAKSLDDFGKDPSKRDGRMSHCRKCSNAARMGRYYANLTHEQQRSRDYYADNREAAITRVALAAKQWRIQNPDAAWAREIKKSHGLLPEQWFAMWDEQDGRCYLCEEPLPTDRSKVFIDHDHRHCPSGKSCGFCRRGLAHPGCNSAIGHAGDSPARLRLLADNLERAQAITAALIMSAPEQGVLLEFPDVTAS